MRFKWIAALALSILSSAAFGQGAQFPAGTVWGNDTASQRPGKAATVSAILDRALGSTRGAIIVRGASGWAIVGPGATAGLAWISGGAGVDPAYGILGLSGGGCNAALTASNGGILYSTASACAILGGTATARLPLLSGASTTPVWGAYTLPASVTSGGVACFTSTTVQASSGVLSANAIILGGGAGVCPSPMGSLGTTTTVLHGNAAGPPTFGAVVLTTDVSGQLPLSNGGCGGTSRATCFANAAPTPTRAGDIIYWNGSTWTTLAGNNSGTAVLSENASGVPSWSAAGSGTVTSVGIANGGGISVSGSPVTGSGSITVGLRAPSVQRLTSGTGATYTTPSGVGYIKVSACGAGGGGGGSGTGSTAGNGGTGGTTTFSGGSLSCTGGAGGTIGSPAAGGTCTGSGLNFPGSYGGSVLTLLAGQFGGGAVGGQSAFWGGAGVSPGANSGSGGSGAQYNAVSNGNAYGGGGAGGCTQYIISSPAATYTYTIGAAGSAGTAGTSGLVGNAGAAGGIVVEEY